MRPLFIAYFTAGTPYETEAAELIETLEDFRLDFDVQPVPNRGDWTLNCGHKPTFIRDAMLRHEGRPLVYVDVDARLRRPPVLMDRLCDTTVDFAACWKGGRELLSGTLYFAPTPTAWHLVREWEAECKARPDVWDQRCLQSVILRLGESVKVAALPPAYTAIFDAGMCPRHEIVIEHLQASRRYKHKL